MKKTRLLKISAMIFILSATAVNAMTFDQARETALKNSQKIKLQDQIISQVDKKYQLQKDNIYQNRPDYIYDGMTKTEVYDHSYRTYDYKEILKEQKDIKRDMVIENENKTLKEFIDILNTTQDIKDIKKQIIQQENIVLQTKSRYKNGQVIKLEVERQQNILNQKKDNLVKLQTDLKVQEKKFREHLYLKKDAKIDLELVEPHFDIKLPKEVSEKSIKNIKQYKDLKQQLEDLNDDMKWIEKISAQYYVDKQQEKIDDTKDDIKEYLRTNLYSYDKSYDLMNVKIDSMKNLKISLNQLKRQKKMYTALYNQGMINKNKIEDTDIMIQQNLINQTKLSLQIKQLLQNYYQQMQEI